MATTPRKTFPELQALSAPVVDSDVLAVYRSPGPAKRTTASVFSDYIKAFYSASGGSALVGFLQAGTSAVTRTAQDKMRDVVSAKDLGAVGDDSTNNASIWPVIVARAQAGQPIHFPYGTYRSSIPLVFTAPANITADPGTRIKLTAAGSSVIQFDYTNGGAFFDHGGSLSNLTLDGLGNATDGLSLKGVITGNFLNVRVTNVTQAGAHLHWAQLCLFTDFVCSDNVEVFTTVPSYGVLADTASCSANTFVHPCIEKVSSHGIFGSTWVNSVFINGTSEGNGGAGIRWDAGCLGNTVFGMDLEVNTGGDIDLNGADSNDFYGLKAGFATPFPSVRVRNGSTRNVFHGGVVGDIDIEAGAVDTDFHSVSLLGTGATITDAGDFTRWANLKNITDSTKITDSAVAFATLTVVAGGGTYNTNARFDNHHVIEASGATLTIANPTGGIAGQELCYTIQNASGGALTVTWGSDMRATGWASPATSTTRTITFRYNGNFGRWYVASLGPTDVPL
jgi:hypothetical protein